jgi:DNA-binding response OmpR family regulator
MFNTNERRLAFGEFQFDPATCDLSRGPALVPVTPKALSLLGYLVAHAGRLVISTSCSTAFRPDVFGATAS